jgi:hypothetical protein
MFQSDKDAQNTAKLSFACVRLFRYEDILDDMAKDQLREFGMLLDENAFDA